LCVKYIVALVCRDSKEVISYSAGFLGGKVSEQESKGRERRAGSGIYAGSVTENQL
jgi:hypothetical protein